MFRFIQHVTVEPSYFLYVFAYDLMKSLDANFYLQKSCRFNLTSEPDVNTPCHNQTAGILFLTDVNIKYIPVSSFFCNLLAIFMTNWSDGAGKRRRPLIFLPILARCVESLLYCLNSYYWSWHPLVAIVSALLLDTISGGVHLLMFACQMYLCDISDKESRTMRLGFLGAIKVCSMIFGKGLSGYMLSYIGFFYSYLICASILASSLVLGLVLIKDTSIRVEHPKTVYQLMNIKSSVFDSFSVIFKRSLGQVRLIIFVLMIAHFATHFTFFGEISVMYSYLRHTFEWNERDYSKYNAFRFTGSTLGALFCSVVLSKHLRIHDGLIGILAGFWDTMAIVGLFLATSNWQIYLVPILDIFHGTVLTVSVSFMSKYYDSEEIGRLSAVNSVFSLLIPLCFPIYNMVFKKTLYSFPSAFCGISIILDLIILTCFGIAYSLSRRIKIAKPDSKDELMIYSK